MLTAYLIWVGILLFLFWGSIHIAMKYGDENRSTMTRLHEHMKYKKIKVFFSVFLLSVIAPIGTFIILRAVWDAFDEVTKN